MILRKTFLELRHLGQISLFLPITNKNKALLVSNQECIPSTKQFSVDRIAQEDSKDSTIKIELREYQLAFREFLCLEKIEKTMSTFLECIKKCKKISSEKKLRTISEELIELVKTNACASAWFLD